MSKSICVTKIYDHPIEQVWSAISEARAMSAWLMPCNFEPKLGHEFEFKTKPTIGFDGITKCKVIAIEPPFHLSYTWSGGGLKNTIVNFNLSVLDKNKTKLHFEHKGFEGFINSVLVRRILARGWKRKILDIGLTKFLLNE